MFDHNWEGIAMKTEVEVRLRFIAKPDVLVMLSFIGPMIRLLADGGAAVRIRTRQQGGEWQQS